MPTTSANPARQPNHGAARVVLKRKNLALAGAACAYIGAGYAAFQLVAAITGDPDTSNWIVAALSLPLAAALFYAVGWIEKRF